MSLKVEVAGLEDFIPSIENGNLILIEGGALDHVKSKFVQELAYNAASYYFKITYLSTIGRERVEEDMRKRFGEVPKIDINKPLDYGGIEDYIEENSILILDSFSYLSIDKDFTQYQKMFEDLQFHSKLNNGITFIVIDTGMLNDKFMSVSYHLCDGIIKFKLRDTSEGIVRYIIIPKWINGSSFDDNIYYNYENNKIKIDSRRRVV